MSCDWNIHILEGVTEQDVRRFMCSAIYTNLFDAKETFTRKRHDDTLYDKIASTPNVCIGESCCAGEKISDFFDTIAHRCLTPITDEMIAEARQAGLDKQAVEFLETHKGKQFFAVAW